MTDPDPGSGTDRAADATGVGAYYTGKDVAAFVARRGIWEALRAKLETDLDRDRAPEGLDPARLGRADSGHACGFETFYDGHEDDPAVLAHVDARLRELTVCDPAAGSGSLLLAAARALCEWRSRCGDTEGETLRRQTLERNLYGVDVRESAAEACRRRLRGWLAEADSGADLPDPELNVRTGHSLLGFVEAGPVVETLETGVDDDDLEARADERYAATQRDAADSLRMVDRVGSPAAARRSLRAGSDSSALLRVTVPDGLPDALAGYLDEQGFRTYTYTARLEEPVVGTDGVDLAGLFERLRRDHLADSDWEVVVERGYVGTDFAQTGLDAFHWPLEFPVALRDGGFDVVLGNPPYGASVDPPAEPLLTSEANYQCQGATDSCEWFYERALDLAAETGVVSYVVTKGVAFYSSWSEIRGKLLEETALRHVFDVGLGFAGVDLEAIALVHALGDEGGATAVYRSEDPRNADQNRPVHLGWVDQQVMRDAGTVVFRPVTDAQRDILDRVLACDRRLGEVSSADDTTRQLYIPDEEKRTLPAGEDAYVNKNRWVQPFHLTDVWHRDLGDYRESVERYAVPRVMLKVLRGSRLRAWLDPAGELVGTEKLVNVPLRGCSPVEVTFVYAALNHPCASYYLQTAVFSGTTETARVMDGPYARPVPLPDPAPAVERAVARLAWTLTLARQVGHDSDRDFAEAGDRIQQALEALVGGLYLDIRAGRVRAWSERLLADDHPTGGVGELFKEFYTARFAAPDGTPEDDWDEIAAVVEATAALTAGWDVECICEAREMSVVRAAL